MSILWSFGGDPREDYRILEVREERRPCFFCVEPMIPPLVHWMGAGGDIYLHPDCVFNLALRLYRDVHEIQQKPVGG